MSGATIIRGGTLVCQGREIKSDLLLEDEIITAVGRDLSRDGAAVIDARGKLVLPGIIDAHVQFGIHYRDTVGRDDFEIGSKAAAAGGVTTFIDFAVPAKGTPPLDALEARLKLAQGHVSTDFSLHQGFTDPSPQFLDQIPEIVRRGVPSFKIYMTYSNRGRMVTVGELAEVMERIRKTGGIAEVHAEDDSVVVHRTGRLLASGRTDLRFFPASRPALAEVVAVENAILLSESTGCPLYVHHVTTGKAVDLIRSAKQRGLPVYGETCPPYLEMSDEVYSQDDAHLYVVNPPIRKQADKDRLWRGIREGSIDVIGTDHCAYTLAQKGSAPDNFDGTPAGFPGVETLLSFMYTRGVAENKIDLPRLVELISTNPAKIFGLYPRKGTLDIGSDADIVIYDPEVEGELQPSDLHMNVDFHPFTGMRIRGQVCHTFLRGALVYADGRFLKTGKGLFINAERIG